MLYVKNVKSWERVVRVLAAALMASCAFHYGASIVGGSFAIASVVTALTAIFGFCPACALAGRRIDAANARSGGSRS